jgi:hypothetical protein
MHLFFWGSRLKQSLGSIKAEELGVQRESDAVVDVWPAIWGHAAFLYPFNKKRRRPVLRLGRRLIISDLFGQQWSRPAVSR